MSRGQNDNEASRSSRGEKRSKKPKKVTAAYLERAALHYLGRFNSSAQNLHNVLERKVRRRNENHALATDEQLSWISDVVTKCVGYGYVDDTRYATQRAEMLLRRGKPVRTIKQDLRHKGIPEEITTAALAQLEGDEPDLVDRKAAAAFVKRRRFGAFRRDMGGDVAQIIAKREKELASMARAGFGYSLANEMLNLSEDEIIDLLA